MTAQTAVARRADAVDLFTLNAYWIGLSLMWNSLHLIFLPAVLLTWAPETQKNTYLGLLTFAGLVIAMLIQPISGTVSDRWASRWGRRRPLILLGTVFDFVFLAVMGRAGGLAGVAIGYIGLQLSSNVAHGPLQGLLPDRIAPSRIGMASGVKNLMDMVGLVVGTLLAGRLVSPDGTDSVGVIVLIAVVLAVSAGITLLGVREDPSDGNPDRESESSLAGVQPLVAGWARIDFRAHEGYWWLIASRFLYLLGIYGIQAFAQYFVRDVLAVPNPVKLTGDLLAAITLALMACALGGGWLADRFGRTRVLVAACGISALGCLLLMLARSPQTLLLYGSVLGAGIGLFITANWALANQLAPKADAGMFLGLTNLATAGAGALGRLEGPLIDLLNNARPGAFDGYTMLFTFGAVCTLASAALLKRVLSPSPRPAHG